MSARPRPTAPEHGGAVDWAAAQRVADWAASRSRLPAGYRPAAVQRDFDEMTAQAEELVARSTGLYAPTPARARVTDRAGWVQANVASMQRLLGPTLRALDDRRQEHGSRVLAGLPPSLTRTIAGAGRTANGTQIGLVLAWLSTRVLGQYDLLVTDEPTDDQDLVYFVGPNVVAMESRFGFAPRPFRLWLALHEVTHRCQFTAVPWLRDYFLSLVDRGLEPMVSDPHRMTEVLRRVAEELRAGRNPMEGVGMLGLVATPDQMDAFERVQALMSLLEGHGDVTMDRAGASMVPGAARFSRVLRERRQQVRGPARLLQQLLGLEAKLRQYAEGERFVQTVERAGGADMFNRVWRGPEWLPTLAEIRAPAEWIARVDALPSLG